MKIKKLTEGAFLPKRQTDGAAGYDLYCPRGIKVGYGRQTIGLGFAVELDCGTYAAIDPRSGFSLKGFEGWRDDSYLGKSRRFNCDVVHGTIDEDYRGEIGVIINNNDVPFFVKKGTRIAQMVINRYYTPDIQVVDELEESDRQGGFGSTGTR